MTMACIGNTVKVDGGLLDVAAFIQKKVDSGSPCRNDGFHAKMRIADQRHYQLRTELSIFDISPIRASFSSDASFLTGFFAFFAFIHSFNTLNARTESLNLFDNLSGNKNFVLVLAFIFLVQIVFTYVGGQITRTVPLSLHEWAYPLGLAILIIPVDLTRKLLRNLLVGNPAKV